MNDLQNKLLEMLKWICEYLENNKYKYYVVYGSFLGAIRHEGFIPWDDDIDIALPRPDYLRLVNSFRTVLDHYKLETPYEGNNDFLYTYSKLYDTNTTLIERQRKSIRRGIYIDIFPLDGLGETYDDSIAFSKKVNKKNNLLMTRVCAIRKQRSFLKNIAILIGRCLFFINSKKLSLRIDKLASSKNYDTSKYIGCLSGSYGTREVFDKDVFGEPTFYKFEDFYVRGPEKYKSYLEQLYGNWKKLPEEKDRGIQHDFILVNLNQPFFSVKDKNHEQK